MCCILVTSLKCVCRFSSVVTRLHTALFESWPVKKLKSQQDRSCSVSDFPHGQLSGSTHPKVWSKAPACNSNSTSLLVLYMHRTCLTAREGGKQAAHETHEARRHRLIPCNFVVLEKKWDYLRFPLRSSIGMVDIRQTCSARADSFHSFVRVGWIQFLFLRQLSLAHLSHRTCHNSEVAQYISFFSCPVRTILYNSSRLQLLKYIIPLAGKQRELSMRQLMCPF